MFFALILVCSSPTDCHAVSSPKFETEVECNTRVVAEGYPIIKRANPTAISMEHVCFQFAAEL